MNAVRKRSTEEETPMVAMRLDVVRKVHEILRDSTSDPAEELIAVGNAMAAIGETLKGLSLADARAVMSSVSALL